MRKDDLGPKLVNCPWVGYSQTGYHPQWIETMPLSAPVEQWADSLLPAILEIMNRTLKQQQKHYYYKLVEVTYDNAE